MEELKQGSQYDFLKQLQKNTKAALLKIIKIAKNWKVIRYFKNQKEMEKAVEHSCTIGDIHRVWLVRNKKTIYKGDTKKGKDKEEIDKVTNRKENTKSVSSLPL